MSCECFDMGDESTSLWALDLDRRCDSPAIWILTFLFASMCGSICIECRWKEQIRFQLHTGTCS